MALDRTWYNTLIDDSGDGVSGSVWDKADVDALMDAVDAEIGPGGWVPYTPLLSTNAGVWSSSSKLGKYHTVGRCCTVLYSIEASSLSVATNQIHVGIPLAAVPFPSGAMMASVVIFLNSVWEIGVGEISIAPYTWLTVQRTSGDFTATSSLYVRGQISYEF